MRAISTIQGKLVQPQAENYKPHKPVKNKYYPSTGYTSLWFFFFVWLTIYKNNNPAVAENVGEGGEEVATDKTN
ncbi:MAG: hypothetical protein QXV73_05690 [Candidatus Micrarchaeia archaeon]